MIFTDIRLQNFRSYKEQSFDLGSGVNIVVGPNAAGKTNLLEALMLSSVGKSYKASDLVLINHEENWARIDTHTSENQSRTVKIQLKDALKAEKTFEIDQKIYKKMSVAVKQPIVLFEPNDLNLLAGEPTNRREYLDNFAEQFIVGHSTLVNKMKRTIQQRNSLLKQINSDNQLLFTWNLRLCEIATQVVLNRLKVTSIIEENISEIYSSVAGKKTSIKIKYESKINIDNYSSSLMKGLERNLELDKLRGFTSLGPHRDDIIAYLGTKPFVSSASRGENRTFMLSLKIIELDVLAQHLGVKPLLLLDDVFSELDGSRRRHLTSYLKENQTIITTTDADVVTKDFSKNANFLSVSKN